MRLIMAISADGFLARGPQDDMSWTSSSDKKIFRLLTMDGSPLVAGRVTAEQLPALPHRFVHFISRRGCGLPHTHELLPDAWLLGGPTVAVEALRAGMVTRAYLCRSKAALGSGMAAAPVLELLQAQPLSTIALEDCAVEIYAPLF